MDEQNMNPTDRLVHVFLGLLMAVPFVVLIVLAVQALLK